MLPRFVKEYASFCKRNINENELMKDSCKEEKIEKINKIVRMLEHGSITIHEAMKLLSEI